MMKPLDHVKIFYKKIREYTFFIDILMKENKFLIDIFLNRENLFLVATLDFLKFLVDQQFSEKNLKQVFQFQNNHEPYKTVQMRREKSQPKFFIY
jgi:hypothetical protein